MPSTEPSNIPSQRFDQSFFSDIINNVRADAARIEVDLLKRMLNSLSEKFGVDVLLYAAPYVSGSPVQESDGRASVNDWDVPALASAMKGMGTRDLFFIVHSPGGDPNAAAQFMEYLHRKYSGKKITAIVPHKAMSAATMMCMGCDEIIMSKLASLGPIDPQFNGLPASAILRELEEAREDVDKHPERAALWAPRVLKLPPRFYSICRDAMKYTEELVSEWLKKRMFGKEKSRANAGKKAKDLAKWLADCLKHKQHARPLTIEILRKRGIEIKELESDDNLQNLVMGVFHAFRAVFQFCPCSKIVLNQSGEGEFYRTERLK